MNQIIKEKLQEIEEKEDVKIIAAVESGSRAWGFASPDSDYDVRFIYMRRPEDYLRLAPLRDVIEWQLDEVLDINGWDLRKALQLLYKSNPTVFEWCASPFVYQTSPEFEKLKALLPHYFSEKKNLYHYWHMAERTYDDHLKKYEVRLKKYFYALRPLLAAKWITNRHCPAPMKFDDLVQSELEPELKPEVERLLHLKQELPEMGMAPRVPILDTYILENLEKVKRLAEEMPDDHYDWLLLDQFFLEMIQW